MRLTDDLVRKAQKPKTGQQFLWDELVAGFGVRLTPTKVSFVVQWRDPGGKKPRESLKPSFPALSVATARDLARKRLGEVTTTSDTATSRPLREAMRSWFDRQTEVANWRPRYRHKVDAIISSYVEGEERQRLRLSPTAKKAVFDLGAKPVGSVKRADVLKVVDSIKPGVADQFMAIISKFYNDAFDRGVEIPNPARNRLRVLGGRKTRHRLLTDAEFVALWNAFESESDPNHAVFAMLVYTGARRREVTQMRWSELDLKAQTWTLPAERRKTGKKDPEPFVIHLHSKAVDILEAQPKLEGSPFVFWGRRDKRPFDFQHSVISRVQAKTTEVKDWRFHDVRRYLRSGMARLGVQQVVAEMCLGHIAKPGLVGVYDRHTYANEKRDAWQKWGDYVAKLINKKGAE